MRRQRFKHVLNASDKGFDPAHEAMMRMFFCRGALIVLGKVHVREPCEFRQEHRVLASQLGEILGGEIPSRFFCCDHYVTSRQPSRSNSMLFAPPPGFASTTVNCLRLRPLRSTSRRR